MPKTWIEKANYFVKMDIEKKESAEFEFDSQLQTCANCEHVFSGNFCPNCGQAIKEFDRPFGFVLYDFLGNFLSFDSRLFITIKYLLFFPGKLSTEFFKGKRISYTPPFRLFIFSSFLLFLLLNQLSNKTLDTAINGFDTNNSDTLAADTTQQQPINEPDSVGPQVITAQIAGLPEFVITTDSTDNILISESSGTIREILAKLAIKLEERNDTTSAGEEKEGLKEILNILRNPDLFASKLLQYTSWAFFGLLPIFALLLYLFNIRKKYNYIRHLIFSVHFNSFLFIVLSVIVLVLWLVSASWANYILLLMPITLVYFVIAHRKFYNGRIWVSIFKTLGIWFSYTWLVFLSIIFVVIAIAGI